MQLPSDVDLCRITIVAPRTRMDLALPVGATTSSNRRPAGKARDTRAASGTLAAVFVVAATVGPASAGPPWRFPGAVLLGLATLGPATSICGTVALLAGLHALTHVRLSRGRRTRLT